MNVDFLVDSVLIAQRQPGESDFPILLYWTLSDQDPWLTWVLPDLLPWNWYKTSYDDGAWRETDPGIMQSGMQGQLYLRKHFEFSDVPPSRLGVRIRASTSLIVYFNGDLVYKSGVSESCDNSNCDFTPMVHWIRPQSHAFVIPVDSSASKPLLAVRLLGRQNVPQRISFHLIAFPVYSSILLSSPACPPTRSPTIIIV